MVPLLNFQGANNILNYCRWSNWHSYRKSTVAAPVCGPRLQFASRMRAAKEDICVRQMNVKYQQVATDVPYAGRS